MAKQQRAAQLLITAAILGLAGSAFAQAETQTVVINPEGGTDTDDGLRIAVSLTTDAGNGSATSFLQVYRDDTPQFFDLGTAPTADSRAYLGLGQVGSGVTIGDGEAWSVNGAALSEVSGSGTAADPWRVTVLLRTRVGANAGFGLSQEIAYVEGEDTLLMTMTVIPPLNNTREVRLYHKTDTNVGDGSESARVEPSAADPRVVGVVHPDDQFVGYLRVDPWQQFNAEDPFLSLEDVVDLDDAVGTDPDSDLGLAVQFDLGAIIVPATVRLRMGFGDVPCSASGGSAATPDTGCDAISPACDVETGVCVPCISNAFCGGGLSCDADLARCSFCADDHTAAAVDTGCEAGAPVCDEEPALGACVLCVNDAAGAGVDSGCGASLPICGNNGCGDCEDDAVDEGLDSGCEASAPLCNMAPATPVCAPCLDSIALGFTDLGCTDELPICTPDATCAQCANDQDGNEMDSGCTEATPLCDTTGATPTCIATCDDDHDGSAIDRGCSAGTPVCDESGSAPTCVVCAADGSGTAADSGCSGTKPVCDERAAAPECVACIDSENGTATDRGCSAPAALCDERGTPSCAACADTATRDEDLGCGGATPVCDNGVCRQCEDSASGGARDFGCAAATPVCDDAGEAPVCVGCRADTECATAVCNATTQTCEDCRNDEATDADTGCSGDTPHCNTSATPTCVACIDDLSGSETDFGCGGDTPRCEEGSGPTRCVTCVVDADAPDLGCAAEVSVCATTGLTRGCVACGDDQSSGTTDDGCGEQAPVCDVSGEAPMCAPCLDDAEGDGADNGCAEEEPFCDTTRPAAECVGCVDNQADNGVDRGCDGERSFCDPTGDRPECVYCQDTGYADFDRGCTVVKPVCVRANGLSVCVDCEDTEEGDDPDFGCSEQAPFCGAEGALASCVECLEDDDCADGLVCNEGRQCAPGCTEDDQCSGELGVCDEEQQACATCTEDNVSACTTSERGRACVGSLCGCTGDDDCDEGRLCYLEGGLCVPEDLLPDPTQPAPDAGGAPPAAGSDRDAGTDEQPPSRGGDDRPIARIKGGSKCAVSTPGGERGGAWLGLLALAACAFAVRRRPKANC